MSKVTATKEDVKLYLHSQFGLDVSPYTPMVEGVKKAFFVVYSPSQDLYRFGFGEFNYSLFHTVNRRSYDDGNYHKYNTIILAVYSSNPSNTGHYTDIDWNYKNWLCSSINGNTISWFNKEYPGTKDYFHSNCQYDLIDFLKSYVKIGSWNFKRNFKILDTRTIRELNESFCCKDLKINPRPDILEFSKILEPLLLDLEKTDSALAQRLKLLEDENQLLKDENQSLKYRLGGIRNMVDSWDLDSWD